MLSDENRNELVVRDKFWRNVSKNINIIKQLFPKIKELDIKFETHNMGCTTRNLFFKLILKTYSYRLQKLSLKNVACSTKRSCSKFKSLEDRNDLSIEYLRKFAPKIKHLTIENFDYLEISCAEIDYIESVHFLEGHKLSLKTEYSHEVSLKNLTLNCDKLELIKIFWENFPILENLSVFPLRLKYFTEVSKMLVLLIYIFTCLINTIFEYFCSFLII